MTETDHSESAIYAHPFSIPRVCDFDLSDPKVTPKAEVKKLV